MGSYGMMMCTEALLLGMGEQSLNQVESLSKKYGIAQLVAMGLMQEPLARFFGLYYVKCQSR